jgi:hypothetical protein
MGVQHYVARCKTAIIKFPVMPTQNCWERKRVSVEDTVPRKSPLLFVKYCVVRVGSDGEPSCPQFTISAVGGRAVSSVGLAQACCGGEKIIEQASIPIAKGTPKALVKLSELSNYGILRVTVAAPQCP